MVEERGYRWKAMLVGEDCCEEEGLRCGGWCLEGKDCEVACNEETNV
jgi:hypothetical protein